MYGLNFGLKTLQRFTLDRALAARALDAAGRTLSASQIGFPTIDEATTRSRQALRRPARGRDDTDRLSYLAGATAVAAR